MEYTHETVVICNMESVQTPNGMEVQHNTKISCIVCLSGIPGRHHHRTISISLLLPSAFQLLCGVGMIFFLFAYYGVAIALIIAMWWGTR